MPLTATVPLEVGAPEPQRPILSDVSQPEPNCGVAPVAAMVDPVPKPALSQRPWLPPIPTGPCSVPGFAFTTAPSLRAPFRPQQQPPYSAAFRSFPENARPTRAIKRETAELPAVPVVSTPTCPESVLKHPLANKWTLWWFSQSGMNVTRNWQWHSHAIVKEVYLPFQTPKQTGNRVRSL